MEPAPSTSTLLQLIDGLNRCVDPEHHTRLITEALDRAGLVDIPGERDAFRSFVSGALENAATTLVGEGVAKELTWTIMRMTSVRAPSSKSPSSRAGGSNPRFSTAEYTDDVFAPRADVLLVGPDGTLFEELRIHLEARGYRVDHAEDGAAGRFRDDHLPRALLTHIELDRGLVCAAQLRRDHGALAPRTVVLTERTKVPEPPEGVEAIMSAASLAPIVEAILLILGPPTE